MSRYGGSGIEAVVPKTTSALIRDLVMDCLDMRVERRRQVPKRLGEVFEGRLVRELAGGFSLVSSTGKDVAAACYQPRSVSGCAGRVSGQQRQRAS